jgi:hypothetical protein
MSTYESAYKQMAALMERSKGIEDFEPDGYHKIQIVYEE